MNKTTAQEIWKRLKAEGSPLSIEAADCIAWAMKQRQPLAKERVTCELHPLHRELIFCFQKKILSDKRDAAEVNAWKKIKDIATPENVKLMQRFYKLPKGRDCDATWNRKNNVATLMNNFVAQLELASTLIGKITRSEKAEVSHLLPEPADWQSRVIGKLPEYHWDFICKQYPDEAKQLQSPDWTM